MTWKSQDATAKHKFSTRLRSTDHFFQCTPEPQFRTPIAHVPSNPASTQPAALPVTQPLLLGMCTIRNRHELRWGNPIRASIRKSCRQGVTQQADAHQQCQPPHCASASCCHPYWPNLRRILLLVSACDAGESHATTISSKATQVD